MANSNLNTADAKSPTTLDAEVKGLKPEILFDMRDDVSMAWVFQEKPWALAQKLRGGETHIVDEMPAGNYIILRVSGDVASRAGFFQVPPPRRVMMRPAYRHTHRGRNEGDNADTQNLCLDRRDNSVESDVHA